MFTYIGLIKVTPEGRERFDKAPEYLEKIGEIIESEGGTLERTLAVMGPWDFLAIVEYPDNETAFRVLRKARQAGSCRDRDLPGRGRSPSS